METTLRIGSKIRALRKQRKLSQVNLAEQLNISASYLNLIEHNRRPLSAAVLIKLAHLFDVDLQTFAGQDGGRLQSELHEVFGDPMFEHHHVPRTDLDELAQVSPDAARAVLHLYHAYHNAHESAQSLASQLSQDLALPGADPSRFPSEQVSDYIQHHGNYFPEVEQAAEQLWQQVGLESDEMYHGLATHLFKAHGIRIRVVTATDDSGVVRRYDAARRLLILSDLLPRPSRQFHLAHQIALVQHSNLLLQLSDDPGLTSDESRSLCRIALANYFASAVLMPYKAVYAAAREKRYDVELLGNQFGTSFEQVCHRLTSLRRPGSEAIPFHFLRVDLAGNVSKRFSASGIQISRYGGACPRWNLHTAFLTPGRICTQVSQMPDGRKYFCLARTVVRSARGHKPPEAVYSIGLGCDLQYASEMVYADGVDLDNPESVVPIGTSCRMCDRMDCQQRAFPSLQHPLEINETARGLSFYAPVSGVD